MKQFGPRNKKRNQKQRTGGVPVEGRPGGWLQGPLLTHMRNVAYAPVQAHDIERDAQQAMYEAEIKRERKLAKRKQA